MLNNQLLDYQALANRLKFKILIVNTLYSVRGVRQKNGTLTIHGQAISLRPFAALCSRQFHQAEKQMHLWRMALAGYNYLTIHFAHVLSE